jgi:phenylalanyl-tRNA synthetase beta chain
MEMDEVRDYFHRLGIEFEGEDADALQCVAPSWRWDLEDEIDYVEEAARMRGFDKIPITTPRYRSAADNTRKDHGALRQAAGEMVANGYSEIVTMSFVSKEEAEEFMWGFEDAGPLPLMNPLTEDMAVMRTSLMSGLIGAAKRNISFRSKDLRLFEVGKVFKPLDNEELPLEELRIAGLATGARFPRLWNVNRDEMVDFYDLKAVLENLLEGDGEAPLVFKRAEISFLHPGKSAQIYLKDQPIGYIGELTPSKLREHDLDQSIQVFEILLEPVMVQAYKQKVFRPIPRYPYMERDLSIIVEDKVLGDDIKRLISHLGHDIIHHVTIFDLYRGKSLPEGKHSYAFRIRYQSEERTLTDEEVQEVHSHVIETLQEELGATLRE